MMRLRLLGLLFIGMLCLGLTSNVVAQDADEWFLAWGLEGQLISYTPEGETTVLILENISNDHFRAWRMEDGSVLALLSMADENGGGYRLAHVTTDKTTFIDMPDGVSIEGLSLSTQWQLSGHQGNYAVIVERGDVPAGAGLLIDLQANTAILLGFDVSFFPVNPAAFSEDGLYFRYLLRDPANEETWTLRELKLETGEERVFYTVEDDPFPVMSADLYGGWWLYSAGSVSYMISRSGEVEATESASPEERFVRRFVGDYLVSWPILCEVDCVMEWKQMPDGEAQTYLLPDLEGGQIPNPIAQVGEDQLLAMIDSENLWLLSEENEPVYLGAWSAQKVVTAPDKIISPDDKWLLVLDSAEAADAYRMIDVQTLDTVVQGSPERDFHILQVFYGEAGFIVSEDVLYFQYYRSSDGQLFDLGEPTGVYWYVLADGTLLFNHYRDDEMARGIYRYDPDSQVYTLLLENAQSLWIEDSIP